MTIGYLEKYPNIVLDAIDGKNNDDGLDNDDGKDDKYTTIN